MTARRLLTIDEAAAHLGVTRRWVRRAVEERRLPYYKLGVLVRFDAADLDAYLDAGRVEAG